VIDDQFTLGVEEEYQIVHPETRDLRSYVSEIMEEGGRTILRERVRQELHQSMVEVGTTICQNVSEVRAQLFEMRGELDRLARKGGLRIVAASTHPFSDWTTQQITEADRYHTIVNDMQDLARANLIFGLHVHVGIKDKQVAVALANQVRYFLPHMLALSCSSPFWLGRKTGLMSNRSHIFKRFPRTGIPDEFESYLARRRSRRRVLLIGGFLVFVGIVAVPYGLMRMGTITDDKFEIFLWSDLLVGIGLVRGLIIHFRDRV